MCVLGWWFLTPPLMKAIGFSGATWVSLCCIAVQTESASGGASDTDPLLMPLGLQGAPPPTQLTLRGLCQAPGVPVGRARDDVKH